MSIIVIYEVPRTKVNFFSVVKFFIYDFAHTYHTTIPNYVRFFGSKVERKRGYEYTFKFYLGVAFSNIESSKEYRLSPVRCLLTQLDYLAL